MNNKTVDDMTIEELEQLVEHRRNTIELVFPDVDARGRPTGTVANFQQLFDHYRIRVRHNEMTKDIEIDIPGENFFKDTALNAKLVRIKDLAIRHTLPHAHALDSVVLTANQNPYHPVRDWIDSTQWDGVSRLDQFYATIDANTDSQSHPEQYQQLKQTMMRKWALSAVAALYHENFSCEGVLCLYGDQAAGKTSWAESLVPPALRTQWIKDAVILDPKDKDSVLKSVSTWITELGELDATFRRADIEAIKGFITEKVDKFRPPYERKMNEYSRRTVFYGTINREEFLQDRENRRFWVIDVGQIHFGQLDVAQFWAEIRVLYDSIRTLIDTPESRIKNNEYGWFLSPAERQLLHTAQRNYKSVNPVEQVLEHGLVAAQLMETAQGQWLNCTTILQRLGSATGAREANAASIWLKDNGYIRRTSDKYYRVQFQDWVESDQDSGTNSIMKKKLRAFKSVM